MDETCKDLKKLIDCQSGIIAIESREEERVIDLLLQLATEREVPLFNWSVTEGLTRMEAGFRPLRSQIKPGDCLGHIKSTQQAGIY